MSVLVFIATGFAHCPNVKGQPPLPAEAALRKITGEKITGSIGKPADW